MKQVCGHDASRVKWGDPGRPAEQRHKKAMREQSYVGIRIRVL